MTFTKQYLTYCVAIAVAAATVLLALLVLSAMPGVALILFVVFRESATTPDYMLLLGLVCIPSIPVFKLALDGFGWHLTWATVFICWIAGLVVLTALIPIMAMPWLSQTGGMLFYLIITLTLGFLLISKLVEFLPSTKPGNQANLYPEWEDYQ